jgi:hypothetical protein
MKNFSNLIRTPFAVLLQTDYSSLTPAANNRLSNAYSFLQLNFKKAKRFFKNSPYVSLVVVIVIVFIIAGFAIKGVLSNSKDALAQSDNRISINKPSVSQTLNKEFSFSLTDEKGKSVSNFKYTIENAELRNEIIVKGQKATAIKGRVFLILNLKINNSLNQNIKINSKDYIRLSVNGSKEKLAPDIHNDPVEVQAISTKVTRLGLAINDTDKDIVLQVGEINGKKESIKLDLK